MGQYSENMGYTYTGELIHNLVGHSNRLNHAEFSPDGNRIVTASWDNTAKIWNASTGTLIHNLVGHSNLVNLAEFSPDGSKIVTVSDDLTAKVWDTYTGELIHNLVGHSMSPSPSLGQY